MQPGLEIERLSMGATIQDGGRRGYRRFGVTKGGAVDPYALAEGRALLSETEVSAALEMIGSGGQFRSVGSNVVACTGAEMKLHLNDQKIAWRRTIGLEDGDRLAIGIPPFTWRH